MGGPAGTQAMESINGDNGTVEPVGEVAPAAPVAPSPEGGGQQAGPMPEPARTVPYPEQSTGGVVDVLV